MDYIQFWGSVGNGQFTIKQWKIYFNLGEISEDVLKDGKKQYENGLGPDQILVNPRPWGRCSCFSS
jgi:cell surface protein SprA